MQNQRIPLNFPSMFANVLRANEGNKITPELMQGILAAAIEIHNICVQADVSAATQEKPAANQGEPNALV